MIDTDRISEDDKLRIFKLMLRDGLTYVQAWARVQKLDGRAGGKR